MALAWLGSNPDHRVVSLRQQIPFHFQSHTPPEILDKLEFTHILETIRKNNSEILYRYSYFHFAYHFIILRRLFYV